MSNIRVSLGDRSYPIELADSYAELPGRLSAADLPTHAWVISHPSLLTRFGDHLLTPLRRSGYTVHTLPVPESETSKSSAVAEQLLLRLAKQAATRVPLLLAFGGGVVGDLTGFVAAVFRRGVPYVQLPTTLLAQVDSSIGGKVGVDVAFAKNLIGAFYQPRLVLANLALLKMLPTRQLRSGLSEIIKYGVMADPVLFRFLEQRMDACLAADLPALRWVVERCCRIKARIVSQDERETRGRRITLNFGHTVGHALESITGYTRFTHGEAIAVGMAFASALSVALGRMPERDHARLIRLLVAAGLPISTDAAAAPRVLRALAYDKKFIEGKLRWVLPRCIGQVQVDAQVPRELIAKVLRRHCGPRTASPPKP